MSYGRCKIYSDGSHFIAIPHTTNPHRRRKHPPEEEITVTDEREGAENTEDTGAVLLEDTAPLSAAAGTEMTERPDAADTPVTAGVRKTTRKALFEELYAANLSLRKAERRRKIVSAMRPYFTGAEQTAAYVDGQLLRKYRNLIARRIRMVRKANLADFNYFVTFTYSDRLHTEDSFRKKLKTALRNLCNRKQWKYIGGWERSPEKQRLHFHGLFRIPEGTLPGALIEKEDYNLTTHRRQITHQNTYFNERFGRSDFEAIDDKSKLGHAVAYILKYIEKTGEKIVYSKGLPQYFLSDVMDEDIVCPYGIEDKKLLLYDDFRCWDEGVLMGKVSKDVIKQMPKSG